MKVNLETELLRDALNKILTVVDKKNARPILTQTLISVANNQLSLSATDLEVSAKVTVPANVDNSGTFCVNAKNLFDIVRELPDQIIFLELNEDQNYLKINCNDIHYTLLVYKNDDFPHLVFNSELNNFSMEASQLLNIIGRTFHAISSDETRLYLNGIYLQKIEGKLRAVATDGHRLSLVESDLEGSGTGPLESGIIIPKKGVLELKKIAENSATGNLNISVDESFMYISSENNYYISIRLISRDYPKYQAVIPNKTSFTMTSDKKPLFDAIKRIKIMSNEKSNGVRMKLSENEMVVMANHPSLGDAMEKIDIEYTGKEMEIGFNAKYLMDTLSIMDEGNISIELNNELSPVVVKSAGLPDYLGIIMPLKL